MNGDFSDVLKELARINDATRWVLLAIWTMDLLALVATAWVMWKVGRVERQIADESRKISFYLFGKLGPLDIK